MTEIPNAVVRANKAPAAPDLVADRLGDVLGSLQRCLTSALFERSPASTERRGGPSHHRTR